MFWQALTHLDRSQGTTSSASLTSQDIPVNIGTSVGLISRISRLGWDRSTRMKASQAMQRRTCSLPTMKWAALAPGLTRLALFAATILIQPRIRRAYPEQTYQQFSMC